MPANADYIVSGENQWFERHTPTWRRSRPATRQLLTDLTDDQIARGGLLVMQKKTDPDELLTSRGLMLDHRTNIDMDGKRSSWLVVAPANDSGCEEAREHDWWSIFESRMDDLREIAGEERLPFNEDSATASSTFLRQIPDLRQPGTFLVNGNIRVVWDTDTGEQVGLQFRGSSKIQFVIIEDDGSGLNPTVGTKSHQTLLSLLMAPSTSSIISL